MYVVDKKAVIYELIFRMLFIRKCMFRSIRPYIKCVYQLCVLLLFAFEFLYLIKLGVTLNSQLTPLFATRVKYENILLRYY